MRTSDAINCFNEGWEKRFNICDTNEMKPKHTHLFWKWLFVDFLEFFYILNNHIKLNQHTKQNLLIFVSFLCRPFAATGLRSFLCVLLVVSNISLNKNTYKWMASSLLFVYTHPTTITSFYYVKSWTLCVTLHEWLGRLIYSILLWIN